jgi:hypothetical protein
MSHPGLLTHRPGGIEVGTPTLCDMAGKPEKMPIGASADDSKALLGEPRFAESMTLIQTGGSVRIGIPYAARQFTSMTSEKREMSKCTMMACSSR